jgi:2-iminobutanoate/2-iminopropanoate deaminase
MHQAVFTPNAPAPIGPYSQAIKAGNMLFVSGQIALHPQTGNLENSDIQVETTQVLENLQAVVEAAGFRLQDVVKCTIFLRDMKDFQVVNEIYAKYFDQSKPARETVAVAGLPKDVQVEISAIAVQSKAAYAGH